MSRVSTLRTSSRPRADGLLTLAEAAGYLQIAAGTLKHWALQKRVEYVKVGKYMRFRQEALEEYIANKTVRVRVEVE